MRLFSIKPIHIKHSLGSFLNKPTNNLNLNLNLKFLRRMRTLVNNNNPNEEEESFANRLWNKFNKESIRSLYTPFLLSLASGNLKIDSFRHYIAQDIHFLKSFAQAYELAEECADDDDDAKLSINQSKQTVLDELKMHSSFCQEWSFDVPKETLPNSATLKYTDFLLATASGKIEGVKSPENLTTPFEKTKVAAYTIGAMVPCMRLYAYLGKKLLSLVDIDGNPHPYKKWIDNYSCEAFQAAALQTEDLLDKLSVTLTGEELNIIQNLYYQAMKLETDFFLAQPVDQQTVVPLVKDHDTITIFSDFDLTCTEVDSSTVLAKIAMVTLPKSGQTQPECQDDITMTSLAKLRTTWEALSNQYAEEYEHLMESMLVNEKVEKFDIEKLRKALEQLSDFEKTANTRVIESDILKGLNLEDIKHAGERIVFQDGCMNFFQSIVNNEKLNVDVHFLSYCWCGDLIRSAFSSGGIQNLQLHANEFIYEGLLSTGQILKNVESPIDKLQTFNNIMKDRTPCDKKKVTIYIGDSIGDLLCMLEADIGIVIGSSSSLRIIGTHFGVSFMPLYDGLVMRQKEHVEGCGFNWKMQSGIVYTVSSWAEIHSFVIGS